jgi:hypothetical protein
VSLCVFQSAASSATSANNSNFIGNQAGYSSASNSNFIGYQEYATSAYNSNFFIKLE